MGLKIVAILGKIYYGSWDWFQERNFRLVVDIQFWIGQPIVVYHSQKNWKNANTGD